MLSPERILELFSRANAIIPDDHFVYAKKSTGWFHGKAYVNKDAVYPNAMAFSWLCKHIAETAMDLNVEVVVGPTIGAVAIEQFVAYWLSFLENREVQAVYAEEEDTLCLNDLELGDDWQTPFSFNAVGKVELSRGPRGLRICFSEKSGTRRVLRRGYDKIVKDKRCLIVEDVINSGATVVKVCNAVRFAGGNVIGVRALCNRSGGKVTAETLSVPELSSLLNLDMEMFSEDSCPICKEKGRDSVRLDLGKGREFLQRIIGS